MSFLTRTLRTAVLRPQSTLTFTSIRHASGASKYPNAAGDQSYPSHPVTGDPNDPRNGKNLRGDQVQGIGNPEDFANPHDVAQAEQTGHDTSKAASTMTPSSGSAGETSAAAASSGILSSLGIGKTHALNDGEDSYVPKVIQSTSMWILYRIPF